MKIAVCEDEKVFREMLIQELYEAFGKLELSAEEFESGETLLSSVQAGKTFDAIFLDIEMQGIDGMETAKELRKAGVLTPLLFLTSHTEFAMDGYEVAAFRYLSKPVDKEKLRKALNDLKELLYGGQHVLIRYEGEDVVLSVDDILYVEAQNNSICYVLPDTKYTVRGKLRDAYDTLSALTDSFVRIHRGYIVNLKHVKRHLKKELVVEGDTVLPVSRTLASDFKTRFFEYVRKSAV